MRQYHHKTVIIPRNIRQHPSEHSVFIESQNNYDISIDNKISEVRQTLLQILTSRFLTQISGNPLTSIRICHGSLHIKSIRRNDHDHWVMVQKYFPRVHPYSGQKPQQRYQLPHGNHPSLLHNTRRRSRIIHSGATWHPISQGTTTTRNHK